MKNSDSTLTNNKYGWQKENIEKFEKIKSQFAGHDLDICLSNF